MARESHPRLDPGRLQPAYDLLQELVAGGELPTGPLAVAGARDTPRCEPYGPGGAIRAMTRLHTQGICSYGNGQPVPQYYGLSWEKDAPHEARLLSPSGFGHGGMAGTYLWIDPEADLVVVFLTNRINWDRRGRKAVLNAVMAALE